MAASGTPRRRRRPRLARPRDRRRSRKIPLGAGSAPHGVIVGPDGAPWITDGGLNAIVRVDPATDEVQRFPLPPTGWRQPQYGDLRPRRRALVHRAGGDLRPARPETGDDGASSTRRAGRGPYGITATPAATSTTRRSRAATSAAIDRRDRRGDVDRAADARQGARRVWSDSRGRIWVSEWNAGQVGVYDPATGAWREWQLPGRRPAGLRGVRRRAGHRLAERLRRQRDRALRSRRPRRSTRPLPSAGAGVRQLLGRPGEVWGAESATDKLIVVTEE